jgi:hypothetical protein
VKQQEQLQQLLRLYLFLHVYVYLHGLCLLLGWTCLEGNLGKQSRQVAFMALLGFFVMYCIILDHHGLPFIFHLNYGWGYQDIPSRDLWSSSMNIQSSPSVGVTPSANIITPVMRCKGRKKNRSK